MLPSTILENPKTAALKKFVVFVADVRKAHVIPTLFKIFYKVA